MSCPARQSTTHLCDAFGITSSWGDGEIYSSFIISGVGPGQVFRKLIPCGVALQFNPEAQSSKTDEACRVPRELTDLKSEANVLGSWKVEKNSIQLLLEWIRSRRRVSGAPSPQVTCGNQLFKNLSAVGAVHHVINSFLGRQLSAGVCALHLSDMQSQ